MVRRWHHPFLTPLPPLLPAVLDALAGSPVADQPAVADARRELSFRELRLRARALAAHLLKQGIHAGDPLVLTDRPGLALCEAFLAAGMIGAPVLHLHALLRPEDITHVVNLVRPKAVLGPALNGLPTLPILQSSCPEAETRVLPVITDSDLVLQYRLTSGSTGKPKVIPLSHRRLLNRVASPGQWYTPGRRHGCTQAHMFPSYQVLTALAAGGTVVFRPLHSSAALEEFLYEERVELLWGIPALYALVARANRPLRNPLPSLRAAVSSGAAIEPGCAAAVSRRWGVPLWQGYGQSELGYLTETGTGSPPGSVGRAVPGVCLRIVDESGCPLPCGMEGRIQARLEDPFPGYLGGEPSPLEADGWVTTGDLGVLDADGELHVRGRETDQIQVAGNKVHAREVEALLRSIPGVEEVAVFALPHPLRGEIVAAAVATTAVLPTANRATLLRFCREHLQSWKCPRVLLVLSGLPRNALGKVDMPRLREMACAKASSSSRGEA